MSLIMAFMAGCLFTLLLAGGCLWLSYNVLDQRILPEIGRNRRASQNQGKADPEPDGGVIIPKTYEELALEQDLSVKASEELLSDLYRDKG